MSVSVVIVNYNRPLDTIRAVRSLSATPAEVIVVDNGSSDGSAAEIREACPEAIVVETERNLGFGGGNNRGVERASGDYVLLMNNDAEVVAPEFVSELAATLDADSRVAAAGPLVEFSDGSTQVTVGRRPSFRFALRLALDRRRRAVFAQPSATAEVEFLNAVCMLVRRSAFERVGGFDERYFMYGEEADLEQRLVEAGYSLVYMPVRSIVHHHQEVTDDADAQLQIRANFVRYCADHHGRVSAKASALLFLVAAVSRDLARRRWSETPALLGVLRGVR